MTNATLVSIEVKKQDDGLFQVVAVYSNGKVRTWSDFDRAAAYDCLDTVEFMAAKVR